MVYANAIRECCRVRGEDEANLQALLADQPAKCPDVITRYLIREAIQTQCRECDVECLGLDGTRRHGKDVEVTTAPHSGPATRRIVPPLRISPAMPCAATASDDELKYPVNRS